MDFNLMINDREIKILIKFACRSRFIWCGLSICSDGLLYSIQFKKHKTFSVLIYSFINANWKNKKLCEISLNNEFFQFPRVLM